MNTFTTFSNRKDPKLVGFSSNDNKALLKAIRGNSVTGYVRQMKADGPVSVPAHAAEAVAKELIKSGWAQA